ncbi:Cupredoxin [Aspergillus pseudoustus]|uniref:Cupredoxin n=1 Tax=Aspergillus pseudoustus TaxID=1810923 RepID=A0ABR4JEQ7_9EURO
MFKSSCLIPLLWLVLPALAADVHLEWDVGWVWAASDGFARPMIGINGHWPCPQVDVNLGDRISVDVHNHLGNQSTGIHWHGFRQNMTGMMDGSTEVTQCAIPPGESMRYEFIADQSGTYWYHSHEMGQYPDGLRGAFIVHDPSPPFAYDDEFTITLTDFYHEQMPVLLDQYRSPANQADFGGVEPLPDRALINDSTETKIKVEPNKTYLVHIICIGNWPGHTFVFDGHDLTVVEVDGVFTDPYPAGSKRLRITTGQRMSVLIKTKEDTSRNYAIWDTMDINMMLIYEDRAIPENFNPNATAWLVYNEAEPLPPAPDVHDLDTNTDFVDDVAFVPADHEPLLEPVDRQIVLDTGFKAIDGVARFTVNGETYMPPTTPTLYTVLSLDEESRSIADPAVYGQVNPFVIQYGEVVEIVINNHHDNLHPWHLHGHHFQVLQRTAVDGGYFTEYFQNISSTPIKRDTIMVQNHGHAVVRFRADNPDKIKRVWLLHCHVEWHVAAGLTATIIEAPDMVRNMSLPLDNLRICESYGSPSSGDGSENWDEDGNTDEPEEATSCTSGGGDGKRQV